MNKFNIIVAMCRNNGIGNNGKLPWHIKDDLKYFSNLTKGDGNNAIVMGNNTWKSIINENKKSYGLNDRDNFILSYKKTSDDIPKNKFKNVLKVFNTVDEIKHYTIDNTYEDIWIIGGGQIYTQFIEMDLIDKCYITYIDTDFDCDTYFPILDSIKWKEISRNETYNIEYMCNVNYIVFEKIIN